MQSRRGGGAASRLADRRSRLQLNTARSLLPASWRTQRGLPLPKSRTGPDLTPHMHPGVGGEMRMAGGEGRGKFLPGRGGSRGREGGVGEFAGQQDDQQTGGSFRSRAAKQATGTEGQLRPLGRASIAARWRTGGKIAGDTRGQKKGKKRARRRGCCFKL